MATPKFAGEIIDVNGRQSFQAATTAEITAAISGIDSADATARTISYSMAAGNRSFQSGRAVRIIDGNKICLAGDGEKVEGRLESVERDLLCTVTVGAQVMHYPARGTFTVGAGIVGTQSTGASAGDFGYVRQAVAVPSPIAADAATATGITEAINGRGSVLSDDLVSRRLGATALGGTSSDVNHVRIRFRE